MLTGTTYRTINDGDSTNFHAGGHITLGGSCDVGNFHWSPRDPLFFLHHAYVDKVFWRWQNLCPQYRYSYEGNLADGFNADNPEGGSSRVASLYIPLDSWSNLTPVDVLDTNNDELCYTYSKSAGDVDVTVPNCPDGSAPNYNPYGKGTFVQKPVRPVPTATTSTAIPSPTADTKADTWLSDALVQLIFKGSSLGFGNAFPQPKAQKRRQDNQEETSISLSLVQTFFDYTSNTTTVTVDCTHIDSGRLDTYTIPEGYELHKAMCNRIVVTPIDYEHVCDLKKPKDWDAAKPMALFSNSLCNLEQELLEPVVYSSDPNAPVCPRFLNDAEIARFHVNPCVSKRNARLVSKTCRLLKQ
ncbi:hypothetical protein BDR26DRAFT_863918 [Obelidium mucronatum]|nr:hypothetical protein BDR26DRAFT_863918 [Obelidium mucronatum]